MNVPQLTAREHRRLADVLLLAAREQRAVVPFSRRYPELNVADACRISDAALEQRIASGEQLVGAKASLEIRQHGRCVSSREPRLAWLTSRMLLSGGAVDVRELIHPRVEPKVAFYLDRSLSGPGTTVHELFAATTCLFPCLEILDSRYGESHLSPVDEIADNCSVGRLLLGEGVATPPEARVRAVRVQIETDGSGSKPYAAGTTSIEAVLWLTDESKRRGREFERGSILLGPALAPATDLVPGSRLRASFGGLGTLELVAR